jgi:hypothetical protein
VKKLLSVLFSLTFFIGAVAHAVTPEELMSFGMPGPLAEKVAEIGTTDLIPSADNTKDVGSASYSYRSGYFDTSLLTPLLIPPSDLTVRIAADANRLVKLSSPSDTDIRLVWGDGTTSGQVLSITAQTTPAADNGKLLMGAGGSVSSAYTANLKLAGVNSDDAGRYLGATGANSGADMYHIVADDYRIQDQNSLDLFFIDAPTKVVSLYGPLVWPTPGAFVRMPSNVPTMAATPAAGTNAFLPGMNPVPTAAANTAALLPATPVPGDQFHIVNTGPNTVRVKSGGSATMNGATAGGWIALATLQSAFCWASTTSNYQCEAPPAPTPQ